MQQTEEQPSAALLAEAQAQAQQAQKQQQQMKQVPANDAIRDLIQIHSEAIFHKNLAKFVDRFGGVGNVPPDAMDTFRENCQVQARNIVLEALHKHE